MSESKKTSPDSAKKAQTNQSWGGRFNEPVNEFVARFTASVSFDQRLFEHDIKGSVAHATMLAKVGVLSESEKKSIIDGLNEIGAEIRVGDFEWSSNSKTCT